MAGYRIERNERTIIVAWDGNIYIGFAYSMC